MNIFVRVGDDAIGVEIGVDSVVEDVLDQLERDINKRCAYLTYEGDRLNGDESLLGQGVGPGDELVLGFEKKKYRFENWWKVIEIPCKNKELWEIMRDFPDFCTCSEAIDLQLKYCDPSVWNNEAIKCAAYGGYPMVVERLIRDGRVDPSTSSNWAIETSAEKGYLSVVERLLEDGRVDPSAGDNWAIRKAAENGHLAVVERLLEDGRVDPSAWNNDAIVVSAKSGHLSVVERLLKDKRVDPSARDNCALKCATIRGHSSVVELLLKDERVGSITIASSRRLAELFAERGHYRISQLFMRHIKNKNILQKAANKKRACECKCVIC